MGCFLQVYEVCGCGTELLGAVIFLIVAVREMRGRYAEYGETKIVVRCGWLLGLIYGRIENFERNY